MYFLVQTYLSTKAMYKNKHKIALTSSSGASSSKEMNELPRYPSLAQEKERCVSFRNWPQGLCQAPQQLAQAGFFYLGVGDHVQCYYCGGGLKNWSTEDDPFIEHAKWYSFCGFIIKSLGQDIVLDVKANHRLDVAQEMLASPIHASKCNETEKVPVASVRRGKRSASLPDPPANNSQVLLASPMKPGKSNETERPLIAHRGETQPPQDQATMNSEAKSAAQNPAKGKSLAKKTSGQACLQSLVFENEELKARTLCKICLDQEVRVVFLPCGHYIACIDCAASVPACPVCRSNINCFVKTGGIQ